MSMGVAVERSARGNGEIAIVAVTRLGHPGEDLRGGAAGLEPDKALAADQLVGASTADQHGMAEPAVFAGRSTSCLEHVLARVSTVERRLDRHVRVDLDVVTGLGAE